MNINDLRSEYNSRKLSRESLDKNPLSQFDAWLKETIALRLIEPTAFALATSTKQGIPSCRTVLFKHFDERGFVFFTNLESRKGRELMENPQASAVWWWREMERQVIVEGKVEQTGREESEEYFGKRPRGSQLGAWSSKQGTVIESRSVIESICKDLETKFADRPIPLPSFWGGFRIIPERIEFWQGRKDRLHDRFSYTKTDSDWRIDRLSP